MGADCFDYLKKGDCSRYNNAIWTKKQLNKLHIDYLKTMKHTLELTVNNYKIALCHFPIDVRYDYFGVWKYNGENVDYFFETNTSKDLRFLMSQNKTIISANNDPLFSGKKIESYDIVIYGHYHFYRHHRKNNIDFYSLNATGVAIDEQAIYYTLELIDNKVSIVEHRVDYNYKKLYRELDNIDYPNKKVFEKYIKKYDIM